MILFEANISTYLQTKSSQVIYNIFVFSETKSDNLCTVLSHLSFAVFSLKEKRKDYISAVHKVAE